MLSIFATADQAKAWSKYHGIPRPRRPLAEKTMARIARGVVKYVLESPSPFLIQTVTASHDARGLVSALLTKHYGGVTGQPLTDPMPTVTATDHNALTAASLIKVQHASSAGVHAIDSPMPTVTAWPKGGGHAVVAAFIAKYYGCDQHGQSVDEPLHTIPTVERFGLVTISIGGEPYVVTDIAMRMLQPRELARAQGFPDDYVLDRDAAGKPLSKRTQVRLIGNSVCPPVIHALVDANVVSQCDWLTRPKRPQRTRQVQKATA